MYLYVTVAIKFAFFQYHEQVNCSAKLRERDED